MKKIFMFLMLLFVLCGCAPSNNAFIHKSEQPYYMDCELQNEYDIENVTIKIYLGLWHSSSGYIGYYNDTQVFVFLNEDSDDASYEQSSMLLKQYDYDSIANDNYVFSKKKKGHNYYISYNSYENIKIPSQVFNKDDGYITLAFSFINPSNNELCPFGGTGVTLKYQKNDNYKISIYKYKRT